MLSDHPDSHSHADSTPTHFASSSSPESVEVPLTKDDLVEIGVCGKGQNGVVKKAIHLPTLTRVALKSHVIFDKGTRHQLKHELEAYLKLQSPYLVSFLGAYHDSGSIIMATEYMDQGSLQSFQRRKKDLLSDRVVVRHRVQGAVRPALPAHVPPGAPRRPSQTTFSSTARAR